MTTNTARVLGLGHKGRLAAGADADVVVLEAGSLELVELVAGGRRLVIDGRPEAGDKGLRESDRLPEPVFTPATKATSGHDENISRAEFARRAGKTLAERLEELSLTLYRFGQERVLDAGIIRHAP